MVAKATNQATVEGEIAQAMTAVVKDMILQPLFHAGYSKQLVFRLLRRTIEQLDDEVDDD